MTSTEKRHTPRRWLLCCALTLGGLLVQAAPAAAAAGGPINSSPPELSQLNRTLTTTPGTWDGFPFPQSGYSYSYAWFRCPPAALPAGCTQVAGQAGTSYVLTRSDAGKQIRSRVIAVNHNVPGGTPESDPAFSAALTPAASAPVLKTFPTISGVARNGSKLTSTNGKWTDSGPISYSRAWLRCTGATYATCAPIAGATGQSYGLGVLDVGRCIAVRVTATGYGSNTAFSSPVGPVEPLPGLPGSGGDQPPSCGGATKPPSGGGKASAKRLKPFPVVIIAGQLRRGLTHISEFTVKGPRGARVSVRCRGRKCPFRATGGTIGKTKRLRLRRAQRSFRPGNVIEIRITGRNRIGKFTRIRIRRGRAPARADSCLMPGARKPSACPGR